MAPGRVPAPGTTSPVITASLGLLMDPLRVAFDVGPLARQRTGVGLAVEAMRAALSDIDDLELVEYIISFRSTPPAGTRRLPMPALLAHRLWAIADHPRGDRFLGKPAVVHGTNYVVPPSRVPQVVSVYDCWFLRNPTVARGEVHRAGRVLRRAIARGATVHASSSATAREIAELFPDSRVATIPLAALPVPEPSIEPPIPSLIGRPYIAAIGTLERRKNLPVLVDAFGLLAAERDEILLVMAGSDGDDRPAINAAIDRLDTAAAKRVVMTGRVDEPARSWLVRNATVLAYPSLDEGFGFPLLDAMQVGVPIVASNRGSIPEVCGAAGLLCEPDDTSGLADNLAQTVFDSGTRERLLSAAAAQLANFSWQRCAADLAALYRRLAEEASK
jgi:glycosyltransferase involved in cell wall biosynthesis